MKALTYPELRDLGIRLSRVHLNRLIALGQFPASFNLSERRIAWLESDVLLWLQSRTRTQSSDAKPVVQRAPRPVRPPLPIAAPPRRKRIGDVS